MRELAAVLRGPWPVERGPTEEAVAVRPILEGDSLSDGDPTDPGADDQDVVVDLDLLERVALAEVGCHFLG
jgi:hypothetical protein